MVYNYLGVIQMIKNKSIISKHSSLDSIRAQKVFEINYLCFIQKHNHQ